MKSFVTYPLDFEKMLFPEIAQNSPGKLFAHYELYKKVSQLEGTVVKCGIAAEEGFTKFAMFRNLISTHSTQKVIAFEKINKSLYLENSPSNSGTLKFKTKKPAVDTQKIQDKLLKKGLAEVDFIPGPPGDAIPDYLIENPELKISFLILDLDDYDATINVLEFFYPRLVVGGILIFDNYYKKEEDYKAITDYFSPNKIAINSFSVNKGPHFIVRR
ncbi:MAG TPA: TylF/MycF/NovP-related O-methyltransferase [Segetibacter sp.]|jgi:hypothetical protein